MAFLKKSRTQEGESFSAGHTPEFTSFRKSGGKKMRVKITLACTECKQRNYDTMKNKKNTPDRLERNKFCPFCKKHTPHRETK